MGVALTKGMINKQLIRPDTPTKNEGETFNDPTADPSYVTPLPLHCTGGSVRLCILC